MPRLYNKTKKKCACGQPATLFLPPNARPDAERRICAACFLRWLESLDCEASVMEVEPREVVRVIYKSI